MSDTSISPCICAALRKASRAVTKKYDEYLKPSGLRITQYSMLANIQRNQGITITELGNIMVMDQTTVTRNLQLLGNLGYISIAVTSEDQRVKSIRISKQGQQKFKAAEPLWNEAQQEMQREVGQLGFDVLLKSLNTIVKK